MPSVTDTMFFIKHTDITQGRTATYLCIVTEENPLKVDKKCIQWHVGGNLINYSGDISTKTADIITVKFLLSIIISTPGYQFMTTNLKNFYIGTPFYHYEYMCIPFKYISNTIIKLNNISSLFHNGHIVVEILNYMYGLP